MSAAGATRDGLVRTDAGESAAVVEGRFTIVEIEGIEVGLTRFEGGIYAIRNHCPHRGAPVCRGQIAGTMMPSEPGTYVTGLEGRVLHCPWHHWEYDITTGRSVFGVDKRRLVTYEVETYDAEEEGERVYVWIRPKSK